jgi:hypothetical protein
MVKKIIFVGAVGASLFLAVLTPAQKEPPPQKEKQKEQREQKEPKEAPITQDGASFLGMLEGFINFCAKVNPQSETYKEVEKLLTNNATDEAFAQIRKSKEYKESFDQVSKKLEAMPAKEALEFCKTGTAK